MEFRPFSLVVLGVAAIVVATLPHMLPYGRLTLSIICVLIALGAGHIVLSYEQRYEKVETTNASEDSSQG